MQLHLVKPVNYAGRAGVLQVRRLQQALDEALKAEDWSQVRRLDQSCAFLIDKVIEANQQDSQAITQALNALKGVYANLIMQCNRQVASMAH